MPAYEDSHLRCPRDGKRMMVEVVPEVEDRMLTQHECWECNYVIRAQRELSPQVVRVITDLRDSRAAQVKTYTFDGERFTGGAA